MVIDAPWSSNTLSRPTFGWNPNSSNAFSTSTSNAFPSTARASGFVPASTPGNNNMFGINSFTDTKLKPGTGSRLAPYSATRVPDERFVEIFQSISAMPVYEAQSHDELRWEDYESLPNNKCSGFKNCDTIRSPFESFKPDNNLFGPPSNNTTSSTNSTFWPSPSPFSQNPTQTQAFNTTFQLVKPNNNPFGPTNNNTSPVQYPNPSQPQPFYTQPNPFSKNCDTLRSPFEVFKPNNNLFGPSSTFFPSPSPFSQTQAFNNNNPFGQTNNNTSPVPNIFSQNNNQTQAFNVSGSKLGPYLASRVPDERCAEIFQSISAMPVYEAKSHEELRWEDYESLSYNKCCGFKNFDTIRSPFESFKPNNNLFWPPNNNTTSSTNSTLWPSPSPFSQNPTQTQAFNTTFQLVKPNNNPFGPTNNNTSPVQSFIFPAPTFDPTNNNVQSFISPAPFTFEPSKPNNNNLFFPPTNNNDTMLFPSPNPNPSQPQPSNAQPNPFSFSPYNGPTNTSNKSPFALISNTSQASSSSTRATEVGYQNINGQQQEYVGASTGGAQSSIGISSLPSQVPDELPSSTRIVSVSQRHNSLPPQLRYTSPSSESKVAFSHDEVDRPSPFVPRENPSAWVTNSLSSDGKVCEDKDLPTSFSFQLNIQEAEHLSATSNSHEADVLSLLPKLPEGDEYYTVPSLNVLAAKEIAEPGSLSRVKDFVVGRFGYGSIKFLRETDVRRLDLASVVQINNRKVIVYAVGKGVNKAAEVTLLNVKCMSKKTGKQYVDGPQVQSYMEMLIKKGSELGAEFVSYDPVRGEWKFRVQICNKVV